MLKIGDRVKILLDKIQDIEELDNGVDGKEHSAYIDANHDKVYEIIEIVNCACQYVLDDDFLRTTSFDFDELEKVTK